MSSLRAANIGSTSEKAGWCDAARWVGGVAPAAGDGNEYWATNNFQSSVASVAFPCTLHIGAPAGSVLGNAEDLTPLIYIQVAKINWTFSDLMWHGGTLRENNGAGSTDVNVIQGNVALAGSQDHVLVVASTASSGKKGQLLQFNATLSGNEGSVLTLQRSNGDYSHALAGAYGVIKLGGDFSRFNGSFATGGTAYYDTIFFTTDNPLGNPATPNAASLVLKEKAVLAFANGIKQSANRGIRIDGNDIYLMTWEGKNDNWTLMSPVTKDAAADAVVHKDGPGTVTLNCRYSAGDIEVDAGTLVLAANAKFPEGQKVTVGSGATLMAYHATNGMDIVIADGATFNYEPKEPMTWIADSNSAMLDDPANWDALEITSEDVCRFKNTGCISTGAFPGKTLIVGCDETDGNLRLTADTVGTGTVTVDDLIWNRGSIYGNAGNRNFRLGGAVKVVESSLNVRHRFYVTTATQNLTVEADVCSDDGLPTVTFADNNKVASLDVMLAGSKNKFTLPGDWSGYRGAIEVEPFIPVIFTADYPLGDPNTAKESALLLQTNAGFAFDGDLAQNANRGIEIVGDQAYLLSWATVANAYTVRYPIHGAGKLIKEGVGTVTLDCAYSAGDIEVANGTLVLASTAALSEGQKLTVESGATLVANLATNGFDIVIADGATFVYDPKRPEFHWQPVGTSVAMEDPANWGTTAFRDDGVYFCTGTYGSLAVGEFPGGTLAVGDSEADGEVRLTPGTVTVSDLEWNRGAIVGNKGNSNFTLAGEIWVNGAAANATHQFYVTTDTQNLTVRAKVSSENDEPLVTYSDPKKRASRDVMLTGSKDRLILSGDWSGYKGALAVEQYLPVVFTADYPLGDPNTAKESALLLQTNAGFAFDGDLAQNANRGIEIVGDQAYLLSWATVANAYTVRYPIHGAGKLIKEGVGTVTLDCAYSAGDIEVANGTLVLEPTVALSVGQKLTVESGATLVANLSTNGLDITVADGATFIYNPPVKTTTWTGAAGGAWSVAANWDNGVPGYGDSVVLTASSVNDIEGLTLKSIAFGGEAGSTNELSGLSVSITGEKGLSITVAATVTNGLVMTFLTDQNWNLARDSELHLTASQSFGSRTLTLNVDPGETRYSDVSLAGALHLWADNDFAADSTITNHTAGLYVHRNAALGTARVVLPTTICRDSDGAADKNNLALLVLDGVTLANDIEIKEFNASTAGELKLRTTADTTNEVSGTVTFVQGGPKFVYVAKNAQLTLRGPVRMNTAANFRFPGYNQTLSTCVLAADGQTFHSLGTNGKQARIVLAGQNLTISNNGLYLTEPGNIIRFDADNVFGLSPSHGEYVRGGCGTVDLNGHDLHIRGFNALESDTSKGQVTSIEPAVLYVNQAYDIGPWSGRFMKSASLVKSGAKPFSLAGASPSTGTAEVAEGDLEFTETGSWAGAVRVSGTGHLIVNGEEAVTHALSVITDVENPTVRITIPEGQSITVKDFYVNGVLQRAKEFDSSDFSFIEGGTVVNLAASHETVTAVWTGGAGNGLFSDPDNWQNGALPYDGDAIRLTAPGTLVNDLPECRYASVTLTGSGTTTVGGHGLATEDVTVPAGLTLAVDAAAARIGNGCLNVRGAGTLSFLRESSARLSRVDVWDGATLSVATGTGLRTAVLELKSNSLLNVASGATVDAFSAVVNDGMPLAKGTYAATTGSGVTRLSCMSGSGRLVVGMVTLQQDARTQAVFNGFKSLSANGKWLASCRTPWSENGSGFRKKVNGKWTDRDPDETDPDTSEFYQVSGVHPYMYFLDFNAVAGTYRGDLSYEQGRAQLRGIIRSVYQKWGAIPAFSWHLENPYTPTEWSDPDYGSSPYSYRYLCAGYPQEHRYVLKEMLENTGAACGAGRKTEALAVDAVEYRNPKRWFDERLDEIAEFLDTLRDENGQRIPVVIRLFHECEDNWSFWGCCWAGGDPTDGSTSREDYKNAFAYVANGLRWRTGGDGTLLFGYCTDRFCTSWGDHPDFYRDYLYRYPGDDVVDILGFDDYSIGAAQTDAANETALASTVKKIKAVTAMAEARGKACGLFETGVSDNPDVAYEWHYRAMTAEGCRFAFLNTWGAKTIPTTDLGKEKMAAYMAKPEVVDFPNAYFLEPTVSVNETYNVGYTKLVLDVSEIGCYAASGLTVTLKDASGQSVLATVTEPIAGHGVPMAVDLSEWMTPGQSYVYDLTFAGSYDGKPLNYSQTGYPISLVAESKVTLEGRKIRLQANTVADLADGDLSEETEYSVESAEGKTFRLSWKDAKPSGKTVRYAVVTDGKLIVRAGAPANGLESFNSYALGLDPTKELAKPAAVVKAGGTQSATGITVHVPNVVKENLPDAGVEVLFQRQKSVDGGKTWTDDGAAVPVGGELTIPFIEGTLYRVNTVLR